MVFINLMEIDGLTGENLRSSCRGPTGINEERSKRHQKVVRDFNHECLKSKEKSLDLDVNMSLVKL